MIRHNTSSFINVISTFGMILVNKYPVAYHIFLFSESIGLEFAMYDDC